MTDAELEAVRGLIPKLLDLAVLAGPLEACGLIGHGSAGMTAYACENVAESPQDSFVLAAADQRAGLRRIDELGQAFWGVYHSHPHEGGAPSKRDRVLAECYPDVHQVIVGMRPADGHFAEVWVDGSRV